MNKIDLIKKQAYVLSLLGTLATVGFLQAGPLDNGSCHFKHSRSNVVFSIQPAPDNTAIDGGCGTLSVPVHSHYGDFNPRSIGVEPHSHSESGDHKHEHKLTKSKITPVKITKPGFGTIMSAHDADYVPPVTQE